MHAVAVQADAVESATNCNLVAWRDGPSSPSAGYAWGGGRNDVRVVRGTDFWGQQELSKATRQLVYRRSIEGSPASSEDYFEILQEFAHLAQIHWRREYRAYCRFDESGDWDRIVSTTIGSDQEDVSLVTAKRGPLEEYLAATGSVLVQTFALYLYKSPIESTTEYGLDSQDLVDSGNLVYRQDIGNNGMVWLRGVQIGRLSKPVGDIFETMKGFGSDRDRGEHVEFLAVDWRNQTLAKISTEKRATTSYFAARGNQLPFEVSPAFFDAEVLMRYKTDREKFVVDEEHREIRCRGGWELKAIDFNEAGQVHAYICYLREIPLAEQRHWANFNQKPRAWISERALANDFEAKPFDGDDPLHELRLVLREWNKAGVSWWRMRTEQLVLHVTTPAAEMRDEWVQAIHDLSILVV